jgi:hypothetical protein
MVALTGGAVVFVQLDPFHVAARDAGRVYRQFTGHDPQGVRRDGTYIGDQLPTGIAYGPLDAPSTIESQMVKARAALVAAGYRPEALESKPRLWCTLDDYPFWRPEQAPVTVRVTCQVGGSTRTSDATIKLLVRLRTQDLHPTVTPTGYQALSADDAPDLRVSEGTVEVEVTQEL